jgi:hypothetical protein
MSRKENLQNEMIGWERRLQVLKEKKAQLGISADPSIDLEIEDIEKTVDELKQQLEKPETQEEIEPAKSLLQIKEQELEQTRNEFVIANEYAAEKRFIADECREEYNKQIHSQEFFVNRRDQLNQQLQYQRKYTRQIEKDLQVAREELSNLDEEVKKTRNYVRQTKKSANEAYTNFEFARTEQSNAESTLAEITQRLKQAEAEFRAAGGRLPQDKVTAIELKDRTNPWIAGSFYLFAVVVLMTLLAVISVNVPFYVLVLVFIGGLLTIAIIGALQLRNDRSLSEENFLILMVESLKRIPLFRGGGSHKLADMPEVDETKNI